MRLVPRVLRRRACKRTRAQSLVEFALILPVLLMLVGGIVQYGMIFATKHSLIQVGRDLGRWASTQPYDPCDAAAADPTGAQPVTRADEMAQESRLMGYTAGDWNDSPASFMSYGVDGVMSSTPPSDEAVEVVWTIDTGSRCPPADNRDVAWVTIRLTHRAPVVLPGFPWLPGLGDFFVISTTATFRMEPVASP